MPRSPKCYVCGRPARRGRKVGSKTVCLGCILQAEDVLKPQPTFSQRLVSDDNAPHVIVEARAGTGKTTTLIEGLKCMRGLDVTIEPSPQQAAVWEQLKLSTGAKSVCFVAFNKSIATELQRRVPPGCDAMTMHSMGFKAVRQYIGSAQVNQYRITDIISACTGRDPRELRKHKMEMLKATEDLVGLCKMNLTEPTRENLFELAAYYDIDFNGHGTEVLDLVPQVLERCKEVLRDRCVDFNDMIWLPVVLNLPLTKYDVLLVDEAQDLNRCQQSLALAAGRRLILCGDPMQAIYGFAGADCESMSRMQTTLEATERGCVHLPLTVTRRCGKAIVEEARKIVPDFDYWETNPEGKVSTAPYSEKDKVCYTDQVLDGDMLLCRVNAPLVSQCFRFLKAGRKATIQGRDVAKGLISTIKKQKADDVEDLSAKLSDWHALEAKKELAKRNPNESRLIALQDRLDCLYCFMEGQATIDDVIARINAIFTDDKDSPGIKLSSFHKAKGLEAQRVFLLQPTGASIPHPMAKTEWARKQEFNILYVAITRSIEELVYVS